MRGLMAKGRGSRWVLTLAGAAMLAACGASPRMVHQSAYYFERCHAADLDDQRTVDERQACWAAWLRHWSSAQPAVRVRYAERRLAALSRGEAMAPLPHEAPGEPAVAHDAPAGSAQVLVEASTNGGPPRIEVAPGEANPQGEASESSAETPVETADRDPIDPSRPGPPPPPVRERPPAPPPPAPITDGSHPCTDLCNPRWDICVRQCGDRGAPCFNACRSEYRVCMGACR
ncbi:MAG: hypothetical protein JJ863_06560 [Deltaproteobacteria bacterium]|nr:hypothetical protein [Deltaproteobacteria bacterium]